VGGLDRAGALLREAADHADGEDTDRDGEEREEHRGHVAGHALDGGDGGGHIGVVRGMGRQTGQGEDAEEGQDELVTIHFLECRFSG